MAYSVVPSISNLHKVLRVILLLQLVFYTVCCETDFDTDPDSDSEQHDPSFFVLCTADGTIYSLNAWSGVDTKTLLQTPPLLSTHVSSDDSFGSVSIVPALDGRLYWKNANEPLPMTVHSLLDNPVRSCADDGMPTHECGVLTATAQTSLVALDTTTGWLLWHTTDGRSTKESVNLSDSNQSDLEQLHKKASTLLLQRKDIHIQHISVSSGKPLWNATLGTYQALDFDLSVVVDSDSEDEAYPFKAFDSDSEEESDEEGPVYASAERDTSIDVIPAVVFANQGLTLVAAHPVTREILWRIDTSSPLVSVFAMYKDQWQGVQVWTENDLSHRNSQQFSRSWATLSPSTDTDFQDTSSENGDYTLVEVSDSGTTGFASPVFISPPERQHVPLDDHFLSLVHERSQRFRPYLELPAPPIIERQQSGILLTWPVITAICLFFCVLMVGLCIWYNMKKEFWMKLLRKEVESNRLSKSSEIQVSKGSDDHSDKGDNASASVVATETQAIVPVKADQVAESWYGIPLVGYSRYKHEYEVVKPLGRGGFGSVFQCRNEIDGRDYAIKKVVIKGDPMDKKYQPQLERVLREVKILAKLEHPNIVRYFTAWFELYDSSSDSQDQSENTMSRCYSSSLLPSQDTDHGTHSAPVKRGFSRYALNRDNSNTSYGNFNALATPTRKATIFDDEDDGIYFEDSSKENATTESSNSPFSSTQKSQLQLQTRENNIQTSEQQEPTESKHTSRSDTSDQEDQSASTTNTTSTSDEKDVVEESLPMKTPRVHTSHTLYIQMQLCSQQTIADFLQDKTARQGRVEEGSIDLSKALQAFLQIAQAVQYIHERGLIHRDLKPSNCFMDESFSVKVGDFGLSREASDRDEGLTAPDSSNHFVDDDHTAGVGTKSYASPEQMDGSNYDASTDVFSLGIIMFELCYPMYTGMERSICLNKLRQQEFPKEWDDCVGYAFPTLRDLVQSMLNVSQSTRPSAEAVVSHIQSLMGEFTILNFEDQVDTIKVRIEIADRDDVLQHTLQLLRSIDNNIEVIQYGLRSSSTPTKSTSILEFAIRSSVGSNELSSRLQNFPEILTTQVSSFAPMGKS